MQLPYGAEVFTPDQEQVTNNDVLADSPDLHLPERCQPLLSV